MHIFKPNLNRPWPALFGTLALYLRRYRQCRRERAELRRLDDHALRDIGITRVDALRESRRIGGLGCGRSERD